MTAEQFQAWAKTFIAANPEHSAVLTRIAEWEGDDVWRWSKRKALMQGIVS